MVYLPRAFSTYRASHEVGTIEMRGALVLSQSAGNDGISVAGTVKWKSGGVRAHLFFRYDGFSVHR